MGVLPVPSRSTHAKTNEPSPGEGLVLPRDNECQKGEEKYAMKLPSDIEFHDDIRLLVYRPRGLLNEASVNKILKIVGDLESRLKGPFNRFFDTLGHDEVQLNYRNVIQISLYRVISYGDRLPVKSAILATDSTIIHYCRLHAIITQDSPINVRIFHKREEAAQWLGVPLQRLTPGVLPD
jgi:hypothetical protein